MVTIFFKEDLKKGKKWLKLYSYSSVIITLEYSLWSNIMLGWSVRIKTSQLKLLTIKKKLQEMIMKHHLMYSRGFNLHFIILCVQEKTAPIFFSAPFFGHVNLSLYLCFSQEKIKPYVRFYMSCVLFES